MAKRKRYKELEQLLTKLLIGDAVVFVLYLLFAGIGLTALKVVTAIIAILCSGLCLAFLYMTGEIRKRRSRWMVMGFGAVIACLLVSLILNYPSPAKAKATPAGDGATPTSTVSETEDTTATDDLEITDPSDASEVG